jgi:hypothetical protein
LPWFHLPSNNVVGNTIHVYRQRDKNPEGFVGIFCLGEYKAIGEKDLEETISGHEAFRDLLNWGLVS